MVVLPPIPGAGSQRTVAGTFRAEQTSETSYDLVSVVSPRSGAKDVKDPKQQMLGRKAKRTRAAENGVGYTVLPALRSVEPLLLDTAEGFFCPSNYKKGNRHHHEKASANDRESRMTHIESVVERLHRGTPDCFNGKRDDVEEIEWLTRPFQKATNLCVKLPPVETTRSTPAAEAPQTAKVKAKTPRTKSEKKEVFRMKDRLKANTEAIFKSAVPGEPLEVARRRGSAMRSSVGAIDVLPEFAAAAFFEAEEENQLAEMKKAEDAKRKSGLKGRVSILMSKMAEEKEEAKNEAEGGAASSSDHKIRSHGNQDQPLGWNDLLDAVLPSKKIDQKRRESCEALRLFIFGEVGNENEHRTKDREKIFYQQCGSPEQVIALHKIWHRIDADGSGRVDVPEFRAFAEKVGNKKLGDKAMQALLAKRSTFSLEDLMRVIWPCAQPADIERMRKYIRDHLHRQQRVKTPPLLDPAELEGLIQTFRHFDTDKSGTISIEELVASGLLDREQAARYLHDWDQDGDGEMDELEFSRMLCPCGFRAYPDAKVATDKDGNIIEYDQGLGWRNRPDP